MHKFKIYTFDLDGTLLSSNKKIDVETKKCIREIKENKAHIVLATGRHLKECEDYMLELELTDDDYVITMDGAHIYKGSGNLLFSTEGIKKEEIKGIQNLIQVNMNLFSDDSDYLVAANSIDRMYYKLIKLIKHSNRKIVIRDANKINDVIYKIVVSDNLDEELLKKLHQRYNIYSNGIEVCIQASDQDKYFALKKILNRESVSDDEVIYFGDSENDLMCIMNFLYSVSMGNASDKIKYSAKYVTKNNDENGVLFALKCFWQDEEYRLSTINRKKD